VRLHRSSVFHTLRNLAQCSHFTDCAAATQLPIRVAPSPGRRFSTTAAAGVWPARAPIPLTGSALEATNAFANAASNNPPVEGSWSRVLRSSTGASKAAPAMPKAASTAAWMRKRREFMLNLRCALNVGQSCDVKFRYRQRRASRIRLKGVSAARRKCVKPALRNTSESRASPACAPSTRVPPSEIA
jgi:hypothetical protein